LPGEKFEPGARDLASAFTEPMAFPWLPELELCNSVYRGAGRNIYSRRVCTSILRQIDQDQATGLLFSWPLDLLPHFSKSDGAKQTIHPNLPLQIAGSPACCCGLFVGSGGIRFLRYSAAQASCRRRS
jgi:hypothetical protein